MDLTQVNKLERIGPYRLKLWFSGALTWPNGYDWCPESLHADMAAAGVLKVESAAA